MPFLFPIDYYKNGLDYYNKEDYPSAFRNFSLVGPDDKHYKDATEKIKEIKPIIDSLNARKVNSDNTKQPSSEIEIKRESSKVENGIKGSIGKTYDLGNLEYKIERVKFKKFIGGLLTLTKADGEFLIISLVVSNKSKEQIIVDNSFFKLEDENGDTYDYSPDASMTLELTGFPGKTLMGMTINPQVSKTAKVVFEVPSKSKNYKLVFVDPTSDDNLEIDMKE